MSIELPPSNSPVHSCPTCKKPLRLLNGKMGPFWGCSGFPACKTTLNDVQGKPSTQINEPYRCPVCTRRLVKAESGYWFCSGYAKGCKVKVADVGGEPAPSFRCDNCGSLLVKRLGKNGGFWGCSDFPVCSSTYSDINGRPDF